MPFDLHTIEIPDGTSQPAWPDRIIVGTLFGITNAAGAAGAAVSTPVTWPVAGTLPANYFVEVEASQVCAVSIPVSGKTANGFNVVLTPLSSAATIAAGTFNVRVSY